MKFKDYKPELLQDKLQQCLDYEAKFGKCPTVTSWKKWCTNYGFRKKEWEFRQNVAKSIKYGI
jgi:hypothetical protein